MHTRLTVDKGESIHRRSFESSFEILCRIVDRQDDILRGLAADNVQMKKMIGEIAHIIEMEAKVSILAVAIAGSDLKDVGVSDILHLKSPKGQNTKFISWFLSQLLL